MTTSQSASPMKTPTSATTALQTPTSAPGPTAARRTGYGALWRMLPRELGFLLFTLPVVVVGFTVLVTLFSTGVGLIPVFVGLFLIVGTLYVARGFGAFELLRLRWAGQAPIEAPYWNPRGEPTTAMRAILGPLVNGHYWLYLLHGMVVNFVVGLVSWTITIVWVAGGLGGVTFWFWARLSDRTDQTELHRLILDWLAPGTTLAMDSLLAESLFQLGLGILFLLTLPLVSRLLVVVHQRIAQGMLGAWPSEALQREVADLSASRGAAVAAENQSLRRLERDIHDGPQQRLVRLQMDLASAERKLATDPAAAMVLIDEARTQASETLEELRALSRGLVPPILQDRGLIAGLESLAARSTIPVQLELHLDPNLDLPSEIERSAYFITSEFLTNAAKHSQATLVRLHAAIRRAPEGTAWLDIWVIDNGVGGVAVTPEHGLAGLDERLHGLRGILSIDSTPAGTTMGAHIPLPEATIPAAAPVESASPVS